MRTRIRLDGGLVDAQPATNIPDNCAKALQNLQVAVDGRLIGCPSQASQILPSHTSYSFENIWMWEPANLPSGCYDPHVFVIVQSNNAVRLLHRTGSVTWNSIEIGSVSSRKNIMVDSSPEMFVFTTGRSADPAQKITISAAGTPTMSRLGASQPTSLPIVRKITCDQLRDEQYTGMSTGSILMYCYCVVNKWGEKSNPSPLAVHDAAQWMEKKISDDNTILQANGGSIKSVEVECQIPDRQNAVAVHLYRANAQYSESGTPVALPMLVAVRDIGENDTSTITITDTNFPADLPPDYENDSAPAADDLAISDGKIFLANASDQGTFPFPTRVAYKLTIQNPNPVEYVNQWFHMALYDANSPAIVRILPDALAIDANTRILDTDRITPLLCYYRASGTTTDPDSGAGCKVANEIWVRIPVMPMNSSKDIYLVQFTQVGSGFENPIQDGTLKDILEYEDHLQRTPVRDEWAMLSMGKKFDATMIGAMIGDMINKANTGNPPAIADENIQEMLHDTMCDSEAPGNKGIGIRLRSGSSDSPGWFDSQDKPDGFIFAVALKTAIPGTTGRNIYNVLGNLIRLQHHSSFTSPVLVWKRRSQYNDPGAQYLPLPELKEADVRMFLIISADSVVPANPQHRNLRIQAFYLDVNDRIAYAESANDIQFTQSSETDDFPAEVTPAYEEQPRIFAYQYYASKGQKLDRFNASQLLHHLPIFPVQAVGLKGYTWIPQTGDKWIKNNNLTATQITGVQSSGNQVGLIRWGAGGSFPQLSEYPTQHNILKIAPLKSFTDTDEHNTMMIWTSDGKLMRLALFGDNASEAQLITDIDGVGRIQPNTLCRTPRGLAWATQDGIFIYSEAGLRNISKGIVDIANTPAVMFYLKRRKKLVVPNVSTTYALMYDLDTETWHKETLTYSTIISGGTTQTYDYVVAKTEKRIQTMTGATPLANGTVTTKRFPIRGRISKIRVKGETADGNITIAFRLTGNNYGGTIQTPSISAKLNTFTAVTGIAHASDGIEIVLSHQTRIINIDDIELEISDEN